MGTTLMAVLIGLVLFGIQMILRFFGIGRGWGGWSSGGGGGFSGGSFGGGFSGGGGASGSW